MSIDLTVIVKDKNGKLFEGADVTVTPGNFKGETNSDGEAKVTVENADRYQVKVEAGDVEQTVPFYPAQGQDEARLEVNLQYLERLGDKQDDSSADVQTQTVEEASTPWYQVSHEQSGYLLAGAIVLLAVIVLAMRAARKKREHIEETKKTTKKPKSVKETKDPVKKSKKSD